MEQIRTYVTPLPGTVHVPFCEYLRKCVLRRPPVRQSDHIRGMRLTLVEGFTRSNKEHLGKPPTATNSHQRMNISARHGENPAFCPRVSRVRGLDVRNIYSRCSISMDTHVLVYSESKIHNGAIYATSLVPTSLFSPDSISFFSPKCRRYSVVLSTGNPKFPH